MNKRYYFLLCEIPFLYILLTSCIYQNRMKISYIIIFLSLLGLLHGNGYRPLELRSKTFVFTTALGTKKNVSAYNFKAQTLTR